MSIQEVLAQYLTQLQGQQQAYHADITNLLTMIASNNQQITEIQTWLANNPA